MVAVLSILWIIFIRLSTMLLAYEKNMSQKCKPIVCLLCFVLFAACDAPHHNPLDPDNPDNHYAVIEGFVKTYHVPHQPIADARIYWPEHDRLVQSDGGGHFKIDRIQPRDNWLYFEADRYIRDSLYIDWQRKNTYNLTHYLNKKPRLDSLTFYTSIINRYPDIRILELSIIARISDEDNDIDTVYFESEKLNFSTFLEYNVSEKHFERERISMSSLGIISPEALIGKAFSLLVKDKFDHRILINTMTVKRIIKDEVVLKSPGSHDTVSTRPLLRWEPVNTGYAFTYTIEIRTEEAEPQLVWQKSNLPANASSVQVDRELSVDPINSYIWAVWIIDEFGNRSRSKFKSFKVEQNGS